MKYIFIIILSLSSFSVFSSPFPIPEDKEVSFDVIRKKKVIGNLNTKFIENEDNLILHSVLDINVKVLFIPAYKFFQETKETWKNGEFVSIDGFTDFEDDREYKIIGNDEDNFFIASGMDGELKLDKKIVKEKSPVHISDYLRGRLNVDTIDQARAIAQDIRNTTSNIHFDDFLKTENPRGDGYRAIHLQLITKDGLSVELQVRLKSTKDILTRSHQLRALGKQKSENFKTAKGLAAFEQAQEMVKKELDDAWFRALEKQGAKSDELIDQDIHIGTRIDADGTEVDIVKPLREFLEEDVKAAQALERLKDCK